MRPLTLTSKTPSYTIVDGDIPCTPDLEPAFSYEWNFCANIAPVPKACSKLSKNTGVAMQWLDLPDGSFDCYIIGRYDAAYDDLYYQLIDKADPSKGVSIKYPDGEKCTVDKGSTKLRSATIDVMCGNEKSKIISAQEPVECEYHLVMESYYGCPTVCIYIYECICLYSIVVCVLALISMHYSLSIYI